MQGSGAIHNCAKYRLAPQTKLVPSCPWFDSDKLCWSDLAWLAVRPPHAPHYSGVRAPVRSNVSTYQPTSGADHSWLKRQQHGFVGQGVGVHFRAVVTPDRRAVDQQVAAAVGADMSHGHGLG
jgi:hypothetical protein